VRRLFVGTCDSWAEWVRKSSVEIDCQKCKGRNHNGKRKHQFKTGQEEGEEGGGVEGVKWTARKPVISLLNKGKSSA